MWNDFNDMKLIFNTMTNNDVLEQKDEKQLFVQYHNTTNQKLRKTIRDTIIKSNLRCCFYICKKYTCKDYTIKDLMSEGIIAMIECFDDYDFNTNLKFAYFATFHIRNKLNVFIGITAKIISESVQDRMINKYIDLSIATLKNNNVVNPTIHEIVKTFNKIKPNNISELDENTILNSKSNNVVSIDKRNDDDCTIGDTLEYVDDNVKISKEVYDKIRTLLSDKEYTVIAYKFGLYDNIEYTNEMIGRRINYTRERVGQLYAAAISKLKKHKELIEELR